MPTVRRYEPGQVQRAAAPTNIQQVQGVSSGAGAAVAEAGQQAFSIGSQMLQQQQELQERQDQAAAKDAFVRFGDSVRNTETEMKQRQKGDAIGLTKESYTYIDEQIQSMEGVLGNDRQRELFRSLANTRRNSYLNSMSNYESSQLSEWEAESSNAMADEAIQYATENYTQPGVVDDAKLKIKIAVNSAMEGSSAQGNVTFRKIWRFKN